MRKTIEAALFISGRPMSVHELAAIATTSSLGKVKEELLGLKQEYSARESPIRIFELEDGRFKMTLKSEYLGSVRVLAPHMDMKRAVVTVLSHVALKQVVTQSELVHKFGNRVYEYVKDLEKRGLIRTEPYRHTKKIITTKKLYALLGEEDSGSVKAQLESAKTEIEGELQARKDALQPVYKTRKRKKKNELPERDITPEQWMARIKTDKANELSKQMVQFEKKSSKKENLEEDYMEVFELKGGADEDEKDAE
jgi:segregation and condensation protein B